jgi:hypothetical protein
MAKRGKSFGQGIGGMYHRDYAGDRRERERERELSNHVDGAAPGQTASLKGGLTLGTTTDPIRVRGGPAKAKSTGDRLSMGWTAHAYDEGGEGGSVSTSGTSIFDPVICELVYRWFCPDGGSILDPFAGGSVRGIVASVLGRHYTGIDLRPEQVAANVEQGVRITPDNPPRWLVGDARDVASLAPGEYDLVMSCPPYADLERYSDDPRDLSTMDYPAFLDAYRAIIAACVGMLRPDRFAVFVVGDIRDRKGFYRNFPGDTIAAFGDAGATLYNEAVLITAVGSLPIRVGKQFARYRKLGKTHQNVIICYKGDPRRIPEDFGEVEEYEPDGMADESSIPSGPGPVRVKVSAAMMRQEFHPCSPGFIADTCHASCCESSTHPDGILVTIHPSEIGMIRRQGGIVVDGFLKPADGAGRCPFKTDADLCGLHGTPHKPFGCVASPFTLNPAGTLIVRNRYRLLKCYKAPGAVPAYVAHAGSLTRIFGAEEAARIARHLDSGGDDMEAVMPPDSYAILRDNDVAKHAARPA